jgi:hypothetical protein
MLEIARLRDSVVVTSIWKFSPDFGGFAYLEQFRHVRRSD